MLMFYAPDIIFSSIRLSGVLAGRHSLLSSLTGRPSYQESRGSSESKQQTDRSSFQKNLKHIITFLTENKYSHPLNKLQSSPSAKDVTSIFEFLVSIPFTEYKLPKKFEDAFPHVMKLLRYPHNLSKRHLQPVGSMHNWPTIVSGLAWFVNILKISKGTNQNYVAQTENIEQISRSDILVQFQLNPFKEYVMGMDDYDMIDEQFKENLPNILGLDNYKYIEEMALELQNREAALTQMTEQNNNLLDKCVNKRTDTEKISTYLEELVAYMKRMQDTKVKLENDHCKLSEEYTVLLAEIKTKATIVATQKITVEEVKQLQSMQAEINKELSIQAEKISKVNEEIISEEANIYNMKLQVESVIDHYNGLAVACHLIPSTAENAQSFNYELQSSMIDSEQCAHTGEVENRLDIILKQLKARAREMNTSELEFIKAIDKFKTTIMSLKGDITDTEATIRCKDEALELSKQEKAQELQIIQTEIDLDEKEISELQLKLKIALDFETTQAEAQRQKAKNEELQNAINLKRKDLNHFLQMKYEGAKQQIRKMQERMGQFNTFMNRMKEMFLGMNKFKSVLIKNLLETQMEEYLDILKNLKIEF